MIWRAGWRLLAATLTVLLGLVICAALLPFLSEPRRMRCVGWWSRIMLGAIGVTLRREGKASSSRVLIAANHVSWIDILAINAVCPARFVSKAEVRRWPVVGWLAACGGTLFIERRRPRDAARVVRSIADALDMGQTVAVFPEGTVGDGRTLLPFHANLLQAAVDAGALTQPVALRYTDRDSDGPSTAVEYHGPVTIGQSAGRVLSARGLTVTMHWLPPLADATDRRVLAERLRTVIDRALGSEDGAPAFAH